MGSKNKRRFVQTAVGGGGLRQEVERLIAKQHFKDAVKQAKLCFQAERTPENHYLLERAYFLRADELLRRAMPTAAREVAGHLLEFRVTDPDLVEEVVRLLLLLGMSGAARELQGRIDAPEARARFAGQEADLTVVHPERASGTPDEILQGGRAIRGAIEAVQKGDAAKGLEALQTIARGSPFADWKLFVRGLAAHSRGEETEARANWERLDPDRAAARIARALQALGGRTDVKLDVLERRVYGVSVLEPLEQLRALLAEDRWDDALRQIGPLRQLLAHIDPALAVRLTRILYNPLIGAATQRDYRGAKALVKDFTYAAERLPIDPHWTRLWALIWEGPQAGGGEAEDHWRKYLKDLETLPAFTPDERVLARALILMHLGERRVDAAEALEGDGDRPFGRRPSEREVKAERDQAVACFEESLRLAPHHRSTYHALLNAYKDWNQPDDAAALARRLLERFPDDFDTVLLLSDYHFKRQEADPALAYAQRARALKPLDEGAAHHEWAVHILRARELAHQERWEEGRASFEAAERLQPDLSRSLHVQARRAAFELKAGEAERAASMIADAQEQLPEATPLWLALLIEAIRYKLPKPDRDRFEARWTAAQPKKVRGETAGSLAELTAGFVGGEIDYPGRVGHLKEVVDYLRRTTRIKYAHDDLAKVCTLLGLLPKEANLYEKLAKRGLKLFPNSPIFLMICGSLELKKGPFGGGNLWLARTLMEKALERAEKSGDPRDARLLPKIRESLSMLKDLTGNAMGLPFGGGPGMGEFQDFLDALGGMFEESLDDDEFDDAPRRLPAPRKTGAGSKKTTPKKKKG